MICLFCTQLLVLLLQFRIVGQDVSPELLLCVSLYVPRVGFLAEHFVPTVLSTAANPLVLLLFKIIMLILD